jgi:hypothetical protein
VKTEYSENRESNRLLQKVIEENKALKLHVRDMEKVIESIRYDVKSLQVTQNEPSNYEMVKTIERLEEENDRLKSEVRILKTMPNYKRENSYKTDQLERLVEQFINFFDGNVTTRKLRRKWDSYDYEGIMDDLDYINKSYGEKRVNHELDRTLNDTRKTLKEYKGLFK